MLKPIIKIYVSIAIFYAILILMDGRGIYNWVSRQTISSSSKDFREIAVQYWGLTSVWRLDEPKRIIETSFLKMQGASHLLYPPSFQEFSDRQRQRQEKKEKKLVEKRIEEIAEALLSSRRTKKRRDLRMRHELTQEKNQPKILLIGDSMMAGIGPIIKKEGIQSGAGHIEVYAKIATGLARPDVYDWPQELENILSDQVYDVIVMMLGTNDSQNFIHNDEVFIYGTEAWVKVYNERLSRLMNIACEGSQRVLWLGLPPMKDPIFNRKMLRMNNWAKRQAKSRTCVEYVSTDTIVGDEDRHYAAYLKIEDEFEKIRMVDGIHLTPKGGSLIAKYLLPIFLPQITPTHLGLN